MNEGCEAWGALKNVMSNRGLGYMRPSVYCIRRSVPTSLYGAEACGMRSSERRKMNVEGSESIEIGWICGEIG